MLGMIVSPSYLFSPLTSSLESFIRQQIVKYSAELQSDSTRPSVAPPRSDAGHDIVEVQIVIFVFKK